MRQPFVPRNHDTSLGCRPGLLLWQHIVNLKSMNIVETACLVLSDVRRGKSGSPCIRGG